MRELRNIGGLHPSDYTRRQWFVLLYALGLVSTVLAFTLAYWWGMRTLENEPRTIYRSLNAVVATMTTTGYGADAPWQTRAMNLLMVTMQFGGVVIGFVTLRVLIIPLFERAPLKLDDRLSLKNDHVVITEYQRDTEELLDELERLDVGYVLLDPDQTEAKRLSDEGYQAINGDAESRADLDRASIEDASLLITDAGDRTASIALTAREANEDLRVVSFMRSTRRRSALEQAGVDRTVAPHALIGRRLAEKATTPVSIDAPGGDNDGFVVREILVRRGSPLHGARVGDSPLANHPSLTLVGGWFDGELRLPASPDDRLAPNTVLLVAGDEGAITDVISETSGVQSPRATPPSRVVVAGLGDGGAAATEVLRDHASVTTIDERQEADPDVVGDVTEPETLRAAEIGDASALVVTVDDDSTGLLTVALARSLAPDVEILARVVDTEKASPAFRAGADYVLSVQRICARLVAAEVHGERVMNPVRQVRLVRSDAAPFEGRRLADVRRRTDRDWTVLGLVRDGSVSTAGEAVIEAEDELLVVGSDQAMQRFERTGPGS
ncbi:potassium channel family protein [Halomarina salina]|uniref:Potassium channel family protein n=1 Tax=Halomarina salina TaxID=1872699 RepID=A0ABD5RSN4_9EURY|nr:NAD-binding protein [Halomarina salina]